MRRLFLLVLVGLVLTGCGGGGKPGAAASTSPSPDRQQAMIKYAQCMRDHGVPMQDPDAGGGAVMFSMPAVDKQTLSAAQDACQSMLPNGGDLSKLSPEQWDQVLKFAQCMRDHGVDMPDPDPNEPITKIVLGGNVDVNSQTFKDAMNACRALRPTPGPTK